MLGLLSRKPGISTGRHQKVFKEQNETLQAQMTERHAREPVSRTRGGQAQVIAPCIRQASRSRSQLVVGIDRASKRGRDRVRISTLLE